MIMDDIEMTKTTTKIIKIHTTYHNLKVLNVNLVFIQDEDNGLVPISFTLILIIMIKYNSY